MKEGELRKLELTTERIDLMNSFVELFELADWSATQIFKQLCQKAIEGKHGWRDSGYHRELEGDISYNVKDILDHFEKVKMLQFDSKTTIVDLVNLLIFRLWWLYETNGANEE